MSGSRQDLDTWEIAPTDEKGAADPRSPSVFGRYEPLELLGRGGMGEVWRVHDPDLGRTVALKVLHPSRSESWTEDLRLEDDEP